MTLEQLEYMTVWAVCAFLTVPLVVHVKKQVKTSFAESDLYAVALWPLYWLACFVGMCAAFVEWLWRKR